MGFIFGLIKRLIKVTLYFLVFAVIVTLIPNLPPYTSFSTIQLDPAQLSNGLLTVDGSLNKPEQLFKGKLHNPETLRIFNDEVYASVATGEIIKISPGGHITFVTKIGQPCTGASQEHICGRILGFDIDKTKNMLYVVDAYYGIWKVDLKSDKKTLLVSPRVAIEGKIPKFMNALTVAKNGDLYWTDSSSVFEFKDGAMTLLADPAGRLFHYNAAKNQSSVLIDNLWSANGVALSPNEEFVLVAETVGFKVYKHYLTGPKKGKTEDFITGLHGLPDNLQPLPDGSGVLIALYTATENESRLIRSLAKAPLIRKFIARSLTLIELAFVNINKIVPNIMFEEIIFKIGHYTMLPDDVSPVSGLIYVDWTGKVIKSYHNTDGVLAHTSDAVVHQGKLYLAAPHNRDYMAAVPAPSELLKAFAAETKSTLRQQTEKPVKVQKPVEKQKPIVQDQKPVVKEQKPVVKEQKPVVKQQKPEVKEQKPVVTEQKPVVKEQKPVVKDQKPVTNEQKPVVKVQKPVVKEQKPVAKDQKPVVKEQKPVVKDQKPVEEKPAPKPVVKEQKPTEKQGEKIKTGTPPPPKPTPEIKPATKPPVKNNKKPASSKDSREKIPIEEEIPSDTAKPNKETLKVIKKEGPAEIPNPHL